MKSLCHQPSFPATMLNCIAGMGAGPLTKIWPDFEISVTVDIVFLLVCAALWIFSQLRTAIRWRNRYRSRSTARPFHKKALEKALGRDSRADAKQRSKAAGAGAEASVVPEIEKSNTYRTLQLDA